MSYHYHNIFIKRYVIIFLVIFFIACICNISGCSLSDQKDDRKNYLIKVGKIKLFTNEFNQIFEIVKAGYAKDINEIEYKIAKFRLLINLSQEMLLINEAQKLGINISEEELNKAINSIKEDYSKNLFERMFIEKAISFEVWKKRLKSRLTINKLIASNLLKDVTILPEDIIKYYKTAYNSKEQLEFKKNKRDKTVSDNPPFLDDNKKIVKYLRNKKAQELYRGWFENLKKSYGIEINKNEWEKNF